ncbi:response regulator [Variovorax robiniae]|uniref:Response regulator n=1 Tax=Variovorax robiniae TaxID=1836199 RepID=A0ABU8XJ46_9BURK
MRSPESFIAVVDDGPPLRVMLGRLLRLAEYRLREYATGGEFLASLRAHMPQCAIVDLHMSSLSGFEVQSRIRAANLQVPVVFITGSDDDALERTALAAGVRNLLRKPFSSDELLEAIGRAIGSAEDLYG